MTEHQTWDTLIMAARGAGWKIAWREASGGHVVITPKAPRRPSIEIGHYADERQAWKSAAFMARQRNDI